MILDFKLSPCFESCMYSFGYFPGVRLWTIGRRGNTQKNTYNSRMMFLMEGVMYMYMYINVMYIKRLIASEG